MTQHLRSFIPGLELNRRFYYEAVRPILDANFPQLTHAAALMGYGSDALGFDTVMSTDHNWGPRLQLFLAADHHRHHEAALDEVLTRQLPLSFLGYPVSFSEPDWTHGGTQRMEPIDVGPVRHLIEITTVDAYLRRYLGYSPDDELVAVDWLVMPEQALLEVTAGQVFHDGLEDLTKARERFAYYPRDVWLYRMAAQWRRIGQEEAFVGRTGDAGDDLGSRIVAARLVRDLMRLAFLLERRYTPYGKWLGTAFARLSSAPQLMPLFEHTLATDHWEARQKPLCQAYAVLAEMHNALEITDTVPPATRNFFQRPFCVLFADRFADALKEAISDEALRRRV